LQPATIPQSCFSNPRPIPGHSMVSSNRVAAFVCLVFYSIEMPISFRPAGLRRQVAQALAQAQAHMLRDLAKPALLAADLHVAHAPTPLGDKSVPCQGPSLAPLICEIVPDTSCFRDLPVVEIGYSGPLHPVHRVQRTLLCGSHFSGLQCHGFSNS
jgi:hypothetical protein